MRNVSLRLNLKGYGCNQHYCRLRFVDPDLGVEILFEKECSTENENVDFEVRDGRITAYPYWLVEKNFMLSMSVFSLFSLVTKKNSI